MIYAFDVFDTLVTRRVATPRGVFVIMQRRLLQDPQGLPAALVQSFAHERVAAEWAAREAARAGDPDSALQVEEIDLADIYACLGRRHGLDEAASARLLELELATESEVLYGVPKTLARFHALAARGERLVLVSDMYLRLADLKRLLDAIALDLLRQARLYLSSANKLNKASGQLFAYLAQTEGVAPGEIVHLGDNPISDLHSPRARGCQASLFTDCHLTADEQIGADEYDLGWQIATGLMREARLRLASDRTRLGAIHAAPLLLPFVHWALDQARRQGYRRLYFLARDGQVLIEIARQLGVEDLELHYLYVSRLSCLRALDQDYGALLDWAFLAHRHLTLADLAYRLTAEPTTLIDPLRAAAGIQLDPHQPLDGPSRRRLRASLANDQTLRSLVLARIAEERSKLLGYLGQEGIKPGERVCLVDIGWSGSIQDALHALFAGTVEFLGLYWGLMSWGRADSATNRKLACAFAPGHFRQDPTALREILECLTAADHGSTLGYEWRDGSLRPILNAEGSAICDWGLAEYRAGIHWFVEQISGWLTPAEIIALLPNQFRRLSYLVTHPTPLLAQTLGRFPYSPDPTGHLLPFAPPLNLWAALTYRLRPYAQRGTLTRWFQGSLSNSAPIVQHLLASPLAWPFRLAAALHPRALLLRLPYGLRQWLKRRLPLPLVRASRSLLRI